ncbi:nuclear envelope phosphatase-regulatory subunit 1-like isoform X1 [Ostrea edulis]|uniref:nuclear envelope phosphatase-regulatory subunit 1-like isoform X1 n=1 Tax=Ostrea edulis TaxID=37623 RepID=UPI00209517A3|nr:nuclear envelope phosphatase-regulatory subunit 1-like isoform X1 [Ostrea edulis]
MENGPHCHLCLYSCRGLDMALGLTDKTKTFQVHTWYKGYLSLEGVLRPQPKSFVLAEDSLISLTQSLMNHPFFTISCVFLIFLFLFGIHKRVVAPSIIASRCRQVLTDFNMSCDETGKLILKPRHL